MTRTDDEPGLNYQLANILRDKYGLDASGQADVGIGGKRIDILIKSVGFSNSPVRIALELEKCGSGKKGEAVKDAASRLIPDPPMVDLAVAMVYPQSCQAAGDLNSEIKLKYLQVTADDIEHFTRNRKHDHRRHAKYGAWKTIAVKEIPTYVSNLHKSAGTPEIIAADLEKRLETVVRRLRPDNMRLLAKSLTFNYEGDDKKNEIQEARARNGAKRALLVVAGAALFHTQLRHLEDHRPDNHEGKWPPLNLDQCRSSDHIRQDLIDSWRLILKIDYRPIFESAITVLETCAGPIFKDGIASMGAWASETADAIGGLRHDLLGRIFHRVLDTARQDGSFYTSTAAAALLAGLAIPKTQYMKDFRVIDPTCGTGTLLMAASERLRETAGSKFEPTTLVDSVIHGIDVNTTACHMAATTLGLLSPKTNFDKMNMFAAEFGLTEFGYRAGSLEMYAEDGLLPYTGWRGAAGSQIDTGAKQEQSWHRRFTLVIMNAPFTRNSLRHDQFSKEDEDGIKKREELLFHGAPRGLRHSSEPMFILLAEKLLDKKKGILAVVRPMSTASSSGSLGVRQFLAKHFHIETIVVSFDPKRIWFSENTNISELLLVARRYKSNKKRSTKIVKLAVNPPNEAEAIRCAEILAKGDVPAHCQIQEWAHEAMLTGDWTATQFYSNHLAERFLQIRDGQLFETSRLGDIANENVETRGVRGLFRPSSTPPPPREIDHGPPSGPTKLETQNLCMQRLISI